jgi:hypothetical protein
MQVQISSPESDQGTHHIAETVRPHLARLSDFLAGEYGGPMEHLWVDLELIPGRADVRGAFSFRFQKRVAPSRDLKSLGAKEQFNVGHFSVRPDYFALAQIAPEEVPCYLMRVVYDATMTLEKKRQLKGFDAGAFRRKFAQFLEENGCARGTRGDR